MIVMKKRYTRISKEDLKTIKAIEEAWNDIENGRYKILNPEEFSKELSI